MNDFCVISLSDLLTKWDVIEKRIRAAAEGDFVTVIYNPMSKRRPHHLRSACEIFLRYRTGDTPCGWVRNISRAGQEKKLLTLEELQAEVVDMFTTVYVGNSATRFLCAGGGTPGVRFEGEGSVFSGRQMTGMVTPRGYRRSESGENEF